MGSAHDTNGLRWKPLFASYRADIGRKRGLTEWDGYPPFCECPNRGGSSLDSTSEDVCDGFRDALPVLLSRERRLFDLNAVSSRRS